MSAAIYTTKANIKGEKDDTKNVECETDFKKYPFYRFDHSAKKTVTFVFGRWRWRWRWSWKR